MAYGDRDRQRSVSPQPKKKKTSWRDEQRREAAERRRFNTGPSSTSSQSSRTAPPRYRDKYRPDNKEYRSRPKDTKESSGKEERTKQAGSSSDKPSAPTAAPTRMIEVTANDRLGGKVRVKCMPNDTIGDLKKLIAAQKGTKANKIVLKKWYTIYKDHVPLSDYEIHDGMSLEMT